MLIRLLRLDPTENKTKKSIKHSKLNSVDNLSKMNRKNIKAKRNKVEYFGDKIFKEKMTELDEENCFRTAAYYFKISYRNIRILHFKEGTFAYNNYFFTTNPWFRDIKMYL